MTASALWEVQYEVVNASGKPGAKYLYRRGPQTALVVSATQGGIAAVLASNLSINVHESGEAIEILSVRQEVRQGGILT
jgi:hypothetical protein